MTTSTATPFSLPLVGRLVTVTAPTNIDGTTANAITATGFQPDFVVNGAMVFNCYSNDTDGTPQQSAASVDLKSLKKDPSDSTQVLFDLYVKDASTGGKTIVQILVY